ncbi:MAG: DNA polymerase III subunit alpha [Verrucomicrobiales bacterium]|nr:DNA polymerase III subunit alpha [Verrucomicrobiales bacterium]
MLLHLDADAFFAAVEQAADARLRGRPVAVGGESRGVVSSASYEARAFGITAAMPTAQARRLCPKLVVLPPNFELYELFSRRMFSYAHDFTPLVEVGSIDEGYLDLSGCRGKSPGEIGRIIRRAISQGMKITVSEGIGSSKLVSQIASKVGKPAGFVEVRPGCECAFLHPLAVKWLPGVGPKLEAAFRTAGLVKIAHVAAMPLHLLALLAGSAAPQIHAFARGEDSRPVVPDPPAAKSYGMQETFAQDVTEEAWLIAKLRTMADALMARVRSDARAIRTVALRLRYNDMGECTRSESLSEPTDLEHLVYPLLPRLLSRAWERRVSVRLLSLRFSQVYHGGFMRELPLDGLAVADERRHRLACTVDALRSARLPIMRGHDLWLERRGGAPRSALKAEDAAPPAAVRHDDGHSLTSRVLRERPKSFTVTARSVASGTFAALNVRSCYSFLDSLLSIPVIIETALARGCSAVALTDPNLHAAVPFYQAAKAAGLHPVIGAELCCDGKPVLCYVENAAGYANLCRLLSLRSGAKVTTKELHDHCTGLLLPGAEAALPEIRHANSGDRLRYDIVQSIRTLTLLRERHPQKRRGDFHWPHEAELRGRYREESLRAAVEIAERCRFDFDFQTLRFPGFTPPDGSAPSALLRRLAEEGLARRYGPRAENHRAQLNEELALIGEVAYEEYFLTVWDLLQECRRRGIHWITRGSAADSLVCYCLEISGVCPVRFDLYFRRFLNRDRMALQKLPDIDVDFAHDRKDEVVKLILERYGPEHSAIVGGFNTFHARSAVAEVAKVLGVADHDIRTLTKHLPHSLSAWLPQTLTAKPHPTMDFPVQEEPYRTALATAVFLDGFPRYAKMHPCGVLVSRDPIHSLTPTFVSQKGWPTAHFDMDAVEAVGLIKLDILAQGGLAVIRDTLALLAERGIRPDLEKLEPWQDAGVWEMVSTGQSRGVHHIESPAMLTLARMCRVRDIDVLIAIVSVIRPGAANNLKKRQFSRRAQGLEPAEYAHSSLEPVLRSTFGVIAYEEHILQICEAFAGLNGGRADMLRRALVKQDARKIETLEEEFTRSALANGRAEEDVRNVWRLVAGFQGYAFCRAHSTAYGVEAYQGAFLKCHHAPEFLAAVLSNGKGFYSPLAYTLECRRLGMGFRLPCVNASRTGYQVEFDAGQPVLRVPLRAVKDLTEAMLSRHEAQRACRPFTSLADFVQRVCPAPAEMLTLIRAGAFDSFGDPRPVQFWQARSLGCWPPGEAALFPAPDAVTGLPANLAPPDRIALLRDEQELFGFTVSGHPLDLYTGIAWETYCPAARLAQFPNQRVAVCGLIVEERLHRQSNGELMEFITLCDHTGFIECEIFARAWARWGLATVRWPVVEVEAVVTPFENANGFTLTVQRIVKPRKSRTVGTRKQTQGGHS